MEREFQDLKGALSNDTVLIAHCLNLPLVLHTDASDRGVGATLSHIIDGVEKPVAFFSKKMLPRQTRYFVTEKKCLAMVKAVRHFEAYLLGTTFQLVTDHKALLALDRTM